MNSHENVYKRHLRCMPYEIYEKSLTSQQNVLLDIAIHLIRERFVVWLHTKL